MDRNSQNSPACYYQCDFFSKKTASFAKTIGYILIIISLVLIFQTNGKYVNVVNWEVYMWWPLIKDGISTSISSTQKAYKYFSQTLISQYGTHQAQGHYFSFVTTAAGPRSKYAVNQEASDILPHRSRTCQLYLSRKLLKLCQRNPLKCNVVWRNGPRLY